MMLTRGCDAVDIGRQEVMPSSILKQPTKTPFNRVEAAAADFNKGPGKPPKQYSLALRDHAVPIPRGKFAHRLSGVCQIIFGNQRSDEIAIEISNTSMRG